MEALLKMYFWWYIKSCSKSKCRLINSVVRNALNDVLMSSLLTAVIYTLLNLEHFLDCGYSRNNINDTFRIACNRKEWSKMTNGARWWIVLILIPIQKFNCITAEHWNRLCDLYVSQNLVCFRFLPHGQNIALKLYSSLILIFIWFWYEILATLL